MLNVPKSCNRQQLLLSVTRGVRSRPLGDATSTKVETVPLLSPSMETELLKEPWVFPRTKMNPTKQEDVTALSAWEEDFQDLSGWCMDTFQGQCDFHIGESTTFKLSGTKYEGNGVSIAEEEGLLKDLTRTIDDEKLDLKMDIVKTTKESSDNRHLLLSPAELVNECGLGYNNEENNASSSWLMSESTGALKSTSSSRQHYANISAPLLSKSHDLDYRCPTSLNTVTNQRETWDELRTIETTGSDTFDLLSYLWEDEMRSLEGSGSTDSSARLKIRPQATTSSPVLSFTSTKVKTEEINEPTPPLKRRRMETRATSTITSSTAKSPVASSRRSERMKVAAIKSKEKERVAVTSTKTKSKNGRKRHYDSFDSESDSEDDVALSQYRECREKNNEASRRSRMNKKAKESEMTRRAVELERDNKILKMKVEELEKLVTSMRNALLRSALKKEF